MSLLALVFGYSIKDQWAAGETSRRELDTQQKNKSQQSLMQEILKENIKLIWVLGSLVVCFSI